MCNCPASTGLYYDGDKHSFVYFRISKRVEITLLKENYIVANLGTDGIRYVVASGIGTRDQNYNWTTSISEASRFAPFELEYLDYVDFEWFPLPV